MFYFPGRPGRGEGIIAPCSSVNQRDPGGLNRPRRSPAIDLIIALLSANTSE
jgi:hypothetical protein